jgi:hypothetical protein
MKRERRLVPNWVMTKRAAGNRSFTMSQNGEGAHKRAPCYWT